MKRKRTVFVVCLLLLVATLSSMSTAVAESREDVNATVGDDILEFRLTEGDAPNEAYLMRIYAGEADDETESAERYDEMERTLNEKLDEYSGGEYSLPDRVELATTVSEQEYDRFDRLVGLYEGPTGYYGGMSPLLVLQHKVGYNSRELPEGYTMYKIGGDIKGSEGTEIELDKFALDENEHIVAYPEVAEVEDWTATDVEVNGNAYEIEAEGVEVNTSHIPPGDTSYKYDDFKVDYLGVAGPHEFEEGLRLTLNVEKPPLWRAYTLYTLLLILAFVVMAGVLVKVSGAEIHQRGGTDGD